MLQFVFALAIAAPAGTPPRVEVAAISDGYSATAPTFQSIYLPGVEDEVRRRADAACAGKRIDWGRFTWTEELGKRPGTDIPTIKEYRRDFRCVAGQAKAHARAPDDWTASPADQADVRRFFASYFAKRDTGLTDPALEMFEPGTVGDPKAWAKDVAAFNSKFGVGARRITGVTWYVNPEQASHPGVFVAIDFVGDHPTAHLYCGYIGLFRHGPGDYRITRDEQNMFARSDERADAAQVAAMRASMCRGA